MGPKENEGNYRDLFDIVLRDDRWGEKSYEKAESKMHRKAIEGALAKSGLSAEDIDFMLAGDLLNEISASNLAMRHFKVPFIGLYNACSTFTEAVLLGAILIETGAAHAVCCSTSSHFASAERQYRYPLELGNQRTPTSQWTVTGAGCTLLSSVKPTVAEDEKAKEEFEEKIRRAQKQNGCSSASDDENGEKGIKAAVERVGKAMDNIKQKIFCRGAGSENAASELQCDKSYRRDFVARVAGGTFGKVVDLGIDDESNMGGAMAPAAADTLITHLDDTGRVPEDYDAIITGDLGRFGREAFLHVLSREGIKLPVSYRDCGAEYFKPEQMTFQGGSGAGCVNTAFNAFYLKKLESGELRRVLVLATGALLNKDTPLQKETIPGISHAFVVESEPI